MAILRSFLLALPMLLPAVLFCIEKGLVRIPLPPPATGFFIASVPDESFPPVPRKFEEFNVDNTTLATATRLFDGKVHGSESVSLDKNGVLYMDDKFGDIWRAFPDGAGSYKLEDKPFVYLGPGRPLGTHMDHDGNLVVCDSVKGLLRVNTATRQIELLTAQVTEGDIELGSKLQYVNDLDIAKNGTIFFTSSQAFGPIRNDLGFWDTLQGYTTGMAAGSHMGKLLAYNPTRQATRALLSGLWFANGVALAADESFALVVETTWLRVHRYWLTGPKAGTSEVVLENLPAFPDGIERASDGGFWLSLVSPVVPVYKFAASRMVRTLMAWLPASLKPKAVPQGLVLKLSADVQPQKLYMEPTGRHVAFIAACKEHDGKLFIGNLVGSYVSMLQL